MIKINLLPKSINEKKIVRNTAILFGVLVVAILVIGVAYTQLVLVPQVQEEEALVVRTKALEDEVVGIEGKRDEWLAKIPPVKNKLTFIQQVLEYNKQYPRLYEEIAKWTYEKVSYTELSCDGAVVKITAKCRSLDDLGRYLLNMYRASDLFTEVAISDVPGYPAGAESFGGGGISVQGPTGFGPQANLAGMPAIQESISSGRVARYLTFTVNCKLKTPIVAPTFTSATGAAGAPADPAAGGVPAAPAPAAPGPAAPASGDGGDGGTSGVPASQVP